MCIHHFDPLSKCKSKIRKPFFLFWTYQNKVDFGILLLIAALHNNVFPSTMSCTASLTSYSLLFAIFTALLLGHPRLVHLFSTVFFFILVALSLCSLCTTMHVQHYPRRK